MVYIKHQQYRFLWILTDSKTWRWHCCHKGNLPVNLPQF